MRSDSVQEGNPFLSKSRGRALWRDAVGPIVVLLGISVVQNLTTHFPDLPDPAPLILVFVVVAGYLTSLNSAILCSLIAVAYALVFLAGRPGTDHTVLSNVVECGFVAVAAPILAITGALLRQSANRNADALQKHLMNTPLGVIELYEDYEVRLWAGSAEAIFGISAKDAVGKNLFELAGVFFDEKDGLDIRMLLEELQHGRKSRAVLQTKSHSRSTGEGHSRWFWSSPLDSRGKHSRFLVLVEDITERVHARQELERSKGEIIERLVRATEQRDGGTGAHVVRMARYCEAVAESIGLPEEECKIILTAAPMHDIGKIGIGDEILLKPGKLTEEEYERLKLHTLIGADILIGSDNKLVQTAEQIALTHHERWDGKGYPNGLKGQEIPLSGRIAAVCDVFDALTSPRPYKRAWSVEEAAHEIRNGAGTHFDPVVVDAFLSVLPRIKAIKDEFEPKRTSDARKAA